MSRHLLPMLDCALHGVVMCPTCRARVEVAVEACNLDLDDPANDEIVRLRELAAGSMGERQSA
jgi:hypothetical protein